MLIWRETVENVTDGKEQDGAEDERAHQVRKHPVPGVDHLARVEAEAPEGELNHQGARDRKQGREQYGRVILPRDCAE